MPLQASGSLIQCVIMGLDIFWLSNDSFIYCFLFIHRIQIQLIYFQIVKLSPLSRCLATVELKSQSCCRHWSHWRYFFFVQLLKWLLKSNAMNHTVDSFVRFSSPPTSVLLIFFPTWSYEVVYCSSVNQTRYKFNLYREDSKRPFNIILML